MYKLLLTTILLLVLSGCSTTSLSPISSPSTDSHQPGQFVWHDLLTQNPQAAQNFYGKLFGWTFDKNDSYSTIYLNKKAIGGMLKVIPKKGQNGVARWISSISVVDVDDTANELKQQGGIIHEGPIDLPNRGRWALLSDPQGAQLALVYSSSGDPIASAETNNWLWHELWTNDPTASQQFYSNVLGYKIDKRYPEYWIYSQDDKSLAGMRALPMPQFENRWIPIIKVNNPDTIARQAVSLGGQLLIRSADKNLQDAALIADPNGALFIVQRWQQQGEK